MPTPNARNPNCRPTHRPISRMGPYSSFGAYFAAELRRLRLINGWSGQEFVDLLTGWSLETLRSVENCRRKPPVGFGEQVDGLLDLPEVMTNLAEAARAAPAWLRQYAELEATATKLSIWDMRVVHGLFQTDDYARKMLRAGRPIGTTDEELEEFLAERMDRQHILRRLDPPEITYVLYEAVIRQLACDGPVGQAQLRALLEAARRPNVLLQVLPFAASEHAGSSGPFTVLEFQDQPPAAFAEAMGGARLIDFTDELNDVMRLYDRIRAAALGPEASIGLITGAVSA